LKGLLKGFWWPFRLSKLVKYFWSYGLNEVCDNNADTSAAAGYLRHKHWIAGDRKVP